MFLEGFLIACLAFGSEPATNVSAPETPPSRSEVETLVRRYYEGIASEMDSIKCNQVAEAILAENFFFTFGNRPKISQGIAEHTRWLGWHHRAASGQVWTIQDLVIENGSAATRFLVESHHQATVLGIPPTGNKNSLRGMDFFRIADGRIVELYRVFDARELLKQLGVICPPEAPRAAKSGS